MAVRLVSLHGMSISSRAGSAQRSRMYKLHARKTGKSIASAKGKKILRTAHHTICGCIKIVLFLVHSDAHFIVSIIYEDK